MKKLLTMAAAMAAAFSMSANADITVGDLHKKAVEAEAAKYQRDLDAAKAPAGVNGAANPAANISGVMSSLGGQPAGGTAGMTTPAVQPSAPSTKGPQAFGGNDDVELQGIFGVGNALEAQVRYRDQILPLAVGDKVGPWTVAAINPEKREVRITKSKKGGKSKGVQDNQTLRLYLTGVLTPKETGADYAKLAQ